METKTFTRQELYDLVWSIPLTTLAKKYELSDATLKRICFKMDIPLPKAGHWEKVKFNKPTTIYELSKNYSGSDEVGLNLKKTDENGNVLPQNSIKILEQKILEQEGNNLIVPKHLTNPDKLIITARDQLTAKDRRPSSQGLIWTQIYTISINVKITNIDFALRFMDTFVKIMKKRGHRFEIERKSSHIILFDEKFEFGFKKFVFKFKYKININRKYNSLIQ